jgi:hypothetical protein
VAVGARQGVSGIANVSDGFRCKKKKAKKATKCSKKQQNPPQLPPQPPPEAPSGTKMTALSRQKCTCHCHPATATPSVHAHLDKLLCVLGRKPKKKKYCNKKKKEKSVKSTITATTATPATATSSPGYQNDRAEQIKMLVPLPPRHSHSLGPRTP